MAFHVCSSSYWRFIDYSQRVISLVIDVQCGKCGECGELVGPTEEKKRRGKRRYAFTWCSARIDCSLACSRASEHIEDIQLQLSVQLLSATFQALSKPAELCPSTSGIWLTNKIQFGWWLLRALASKLPTAACHCAVPTCRRLKQIKWNGSLLNIYLHTNGVYKAPNTSLDVISRIVDSLWPISHPIYSISIKMKQCLQAFATL